MRERHLYMRIQNKTKKYYFLLFGASKHYLSSDHSLITSQSRERERERREEGGGRESVCSYETNETMLTRQK